MSSEHASLEPKGQKGRYVALFLLIIVYTLNFLDRQILAILSVPIAKEFHLTDTQMGVMVGLSFAIVYSFLAIPAAWIADRSSRSWIRTIALALWSGFTAFCGLATTYSQLVIARMGVGVGEAGGVAPAYSLIADYFPPKQRATALAIYSYGIPIGAAAGILFGGLMAKSVGWRQAFMTIGIIGVVLAIPFKLMVRDPKRGVFDKAGTPAKSENFFKVAGAVRAKPTFWLLSLGAASSSMVGYGLLNWMPTFLVRSAHMKLDQVAWFLSSLILIGGVIGMSLGGVMADWLGKRSKAWYAILPAVSFLISGPLYALGVLDPAIGSAFWIFIIPQALGLVWLGPVLTAVQHMGPSASRTQISSLFLLINNLLGIGLGTYGIGKISDLLKPTYGVDSVKWAFVYGLGFYGLAALFLFLASTRLKKDWVE